MKQIDQIVYIVVLLALVALSYQVGGMIGKEKAMGDIVTVSPIEMGKIEDEIYLTDRITSGVIQACNDIKSDNKMLREAYNRCENKVMDCSRCK